MHFPFRIYPIPHQKNIQLHVLCRYNMHGQLKNTIFQRKEDCPTEYKRMPWITKSSRRLYLKMLSVTLSPLIDIFCTSIHHYCSRVDITYRLLVIWTKKEAIYSGQCLLGAPYLMNPTCAY
jgi:hypothetical protein